MNGFDEIELCQSREMSTTSSIPKFSAIAVTLNSDFVSDEISGC